MKITLNSIHDMISDYTVRTDRKFQEIDGRLQSITDNHLTHLKEDVGDLSLKVEANTTNIGWLKEKISSLSNRFWAILLIVLTSLIGIIINTYLTLS